MTVPLFYYLFLLSQFIVTAWGGFYYKSLPRPLKILEWWMILCTLESIVKLVMVFHGMRTLWLSHFYTPVELILITGMFVSWIKAKKIRSIFWGCLICFFIVWIVSKFTFESLYMNDDTTSTFSKVIQIFFSVYLLIEINKESDLPWVSDSRIWVSTSILLYSAGILFWYALFNKMLIVSPEKLVLMYYWNWVLMIISNVLFIKAFQCRK